MNTAQDGLHEDFTYGAVVDVGLECIVIAIEPGKDNADLQLQPVLTPPVVTLQSNQIYLPDNGVLQNG